MLAPEIAQKVNEYLVLEASEPPKARIADYVKWKDRMDAARQNLSADIETTAASARVVGVTVATAVRWHHRLQNPRFPFVLCDEASQVLGPAAMMMAALGAQAIFAGDPQQLSPIAKSDSAAVRGALTRTAFDVFAHVRTARLNEQSRMAQAICHIVGTTFYGGDLLVCKKANRDDGWRASRSPFFVNGRQVPRVCFDPVGEEATFSTKYGGFIRFESAKLVLAALDELAGSYVDAKDIVVLTPYRAQVALLRSMLRRDHAQVSVSTVHRAQGSERTLVIFDPVDASSTFFNGAEGDRLINVAISRAKAHVVIPYHANDLRKPAMKQMHGIAAKLWQTAGDYAAPFTFR
ncbi:DEAD/DEAH box helicase [Sphingomonas aerolata]|uniref:DEAD/DEAH box helicase n=1 Tax=Sphingomonas aerolata TaxID=185951 RepID=UPI002FE325FC